MFCPKCGHQQASETTRYCSRCGMPLDGVTDLLSSNDDSLKREKLEVTGISLIIATVIVLLVYLAVLGGVAIANIEKSAPARTMSFLTIWLTFLGVALGLGIGGIVSLIRSGFFKKLKERQIRLQIASLEKRKKKLESAVNTGKLIEEKPALQTSDFMSVTETTTRNLEADDRTAAKVRASE
jgi:hypothetical protein